MRSAKAAAAAAPPAAAAAASEGREPSGIKFAVGKPIMTPAAERLRVSGLSEPAARNWDTNFL
jgi:hypothetical protein